MEGALVTDDAMQCQQQACAYITEQRLADYLIHDDDWTASLYVDLICTRHG